LGAWAACEFHMAPIDAAFFNHNEFVDCLMESGMPVPRTLTRVEWSVIRSRLGKARRLSTAFLAEERQRLHRTRENVRALTNNRVRLDVHCVDHVVTVTICSRLHIPISK
jgi:hypothetical protein